MDRLVLSTLQRLQAVKSEIERIERSTFPQGSSKTLLLSLKGRITEQIQILLNQENFHSESSVQTRCRGAIIEAYRVIPLVGVAVRSSSIRLAFEVCEALQGICKNLLVKNDLADFTIEVALSSEWDYSPLIQPRREGIEQFVLLGMPAHESDNPLLLPLMGHEIGHAIWQRCPSETEGGVLAAFRNEATLELFNLIAASWELYREVFSLKLDARSGMEGQDLLADRPLWQYFVGPRSALARQAEETFCDFIGVRIFGASYLRAFAHVAAPPIYSGATETYPGMSLRARHIACALCSLELEIPPTFLSDFSLERQKRFEFPQVQPPIDIEKVRSKPKALYGAMAEQALLKVAPLLLRTACEMCDNAGVPLPTPAEIQGAQLALLNDVPDSNSTSLGSLLEAAWLVAEAFDEADRLAEPDGSLEGKADALRQSLLKSIELLALRTAFH